MMTRELKSLFRRDAFGHKCADHQKNTFNGNGRGKQGTQLYIL